MRRYRRRGAVINERDEHLFHYLFVNKAAAVVDIQKDVFDNANLKTVHNRLKKLSDAGFIEAQIHRERRNRLVYFVTKKAFRKYVAEEGLAKRVQLISDSIEHDLIVLEIKRKFRTFKKYVLEFYSENLIRSGLLEDQYPELEPFRWLRPDAVVKLKIKDKIYFLPLEYEASPKSKKRNAKLLSRYYTSSKVVAVLFISRTKAIEKKMWQAEMTRGAEKRKGKFYYAQLEDVLNSQEKLPFWSVKDDILTLA